MSGAADTRPWAVCKYGGTSVATSATWAQIVARVRVLLPTHRVWLVVSAVSKVTNLLLSCIAEAISPSASGDARFASFSAVVKIHEELAASLGGTAADFIPVSDLLAELRRLLEGIALTGEASARLRARVAAHGELLSSLVGAAFLARSLTGTKVTRVDARALLVSSERGDEGSSRGDDVFLEADVVPSTQPERADLSAAGASVVIAQGFIASTPEGATCLLGRGGSDTSGALFAAFCAASHLEIWTDVNGMFSADPRYVPSARLLRALTYREAQELAAMGARVLHPRCLIPAAFAGVAVEVRNTMDASDDAELTVINSDGSGARAGARGPNFKRRVSEDTPGYTPMPEQRSPSPSGSIIFSNADAPRSPTDGRESPTRDAAPPPPVTLSRSPPGARVLAIARRKGVTLLTLSNYDMWGSAGFLSRAFAPFGAAGVSVDMIATSQYAVSVTLDHIPEGTTGGVFRRLCTSLGRIATTTVRYPCAVVSVVGRSLRNALPSLGPGLRALEGVTVYMVAQAAEDLSLSFVVDEEHADALVARLHAELLEGEKSGAATLGPLFSDLPCGKQALPGDAKH